MAEPEILSKKRRRPSSSSSGGSRGPSFTRILTRSKSQIYVHCHRSGRARADSLRFSKLNSALHSAPVVFTSKSKRPRRRSRGRGWDGVDSPAPDDWSCNIQIKDLRARRVLSLPSAAPGEGKLRVVGDDDEEKVEGSKKGRGQILQVEAVGSDSLMDKIQNCFGDAGPLGNGGDGSTSLKDFERNEKISWGDGEIPNRVGDFDEECVQATPPDAEILNHVYGNEDENAGFVPKQKPFLGSNERSQDLPDIADRNQIVVRQRGRVKIFKSPGSLSYKRLLPYLMDIGKDDSCEKDRSSMKIENVITNKSISEGFYKDGHRDDSKTLILGAPILVNASHSVSDASSLPAASVSDSPVPCSLLKSVCMGPSFADNRCSKPVVNQGDKCVSNLNSGYYSSMGCYCLNTHSNGLVLAGEGDSKGIDAQNLNNKRHVSPLTREKYQVLGKPLNVGTCIIDSHISSKRPRSSPGRKLGLSPCSQLKLFNTPTSFSYRRLLPYLMDITKDNSVEESSELNPPSKFSTSELHESPSEKLNRQNFHLEDEGKDMHTLRRAISTATNNASNVQQPSLTYPEHTSGTLVSFGSQEQHRFQVVKVTTEKDGQLKPTRGIRTSINGSSLLIGDSSISMPDDLTVNCKADSIASLINPTRPANPADADILCSTSQIEVFDPLKLSDNGSRRGILKRNPRGCRGICTCLNCASFRLHAERAFEFSKNQMEDAEEVALDLVKELAHLRKVVVTFVANSDDSAVFSNDQVNEACKKAAKAEELAKGRLVQMKDDLNIHCRITCGQRPKVRFANEVDERIIS